MQGFAAETLGNGVRFLAVHYSADPEKGPEWVAEQRVGVPVNDWDRQMEMREDVYDGKPVYADFIPGFHDRTGLRVLPGSKDFGGWDCGATLIPAYVHLQLTEEKQVQAVLEEVSLGEDAMETFAPKVAEALRELIPERMGDVEHWADATVTQRSGTRKESAAQVAQEHGFDLYASSNVWAPRWSAVTWLLTDRLPNGEPRFVIDREKCPILYEGFKGAYKFQESPRGDSTGPGMILGMPLKNGFSHVHDALQYPAMRIRRLIEGDVTATASTSTTTMARSPAAAAPSYDAQGRFIPPPRKRR
jgi:hypothetical protein